MPQCTFVSRQIYETQFTRREIEEFLKRECVKAGLPMDMDKHAPHFEWNEAGCLVSFLSHQKTEAAKPEIQMEAPL